MLALRLRPQFRPVLLLIALAAFAAAVLFLFDPGHWAFYPGCVFYRTTGLLCPGCGSLRACHQLLHGHFAAALHCNPLLIVSFVVAALYVLINLRNRKPERGHFCPQPRPTSRPVSKSTWPDLNIEARRGQECPRSAWLQPFWLWVYLVVVLVFWVARNLPGPMFAMLRP